MPAQANIKKLPKVKEKPKVEPLTGKDLEEAMKFIDLLVEIYFDDIMQQ